MKNFLIYPFTIFILLFSNFCIANAVGFETNTKIEQTAERIITGLVFDENGFPLYDATIETSNGMSTFTDSNGEFQIQISDGVESLRISYIGYTTKELILTEENYYEIQLEPGNIVLSQVVATGYSKEKRRNITAAIASVQPEEIKNLPKSDVTEMLEGKLAGVNIMSDNSPGGGNSIRIRGFSTINSNDPLIIIDGVPVSNGLNSINPNDIESLQVLKDGASASIYGARAANGVVVITTKNGGSNSETQFSFDGYAGVQEAFNLPKMLTAQQYGEVLWEAASNDGIDISNDIYGDGNSPVIPQWLNSEQTIASGDTDWVDEIFDPAMIQSYNLGLQRGGTNGKQYFGLGYLKQEGIIKHTGFERFQARINSDYKVGEIFTFGENLNASLTKKVSIGTNSALGSIVYDAMQFPSIVPVKDSNGEYAGNPLNDLSNPMGRLYRNKDNDRKFLRLIGNVYAQAKYADFTFNTSLGIDFENSNYRGFSPTYDEILSANNTNSLNTNTNFNYQLTWSNTLNYTKKIGVHNFDILLGQEAVQYYSEGFSASRQDFLYEDENFWYLDYGTENQLNSGNAFEWKLNSIFGKLHYNYLEKYLLTATIRRDGTSRLSNNKYGTFPAFSAGWRIDKEEFFEGNFVSSLMLRLGWGQTGNQEIPPYSTVDSYVSNSSNSNYDIDGAQNSVVTGLTPSRIANPDLKWETTSQTSIGLDLGLFEDKLTITADYYNKVTDDILVFTTVPLTYGGTNDGMWINDGEMSNVGFEFLANYKTYYDDFNYNIGLNFSTYTNELKSLNSVEYLGIPSSTLHSVNFDQEVSRSAVGEPIGSFYGFVANGLFNSQEEVNAHGVQPQAKPGDIRFEDINNDGVIDDDDRTFIGSPHPDFTLGLNLNFEYKNFDLGLFFNGSFGNDIYNLTKYKLHFFNQAAYNKSEEILHAWTPDNHSNIPRLSLDDPNNNIRPSSYYVEDGSYFKLNNLTFGYTFNDLGNLENSLRIYGQVSNVFTITDYTGLTPQIGLQNYSSQNRNLDIGIDRGLYPPSRTFTLGLNFNF